MIFNCILCVSLWWARLSYIAKTSWHNIKNIFKQSYIIVCLLTVEGNNISVCICHNIRVKITMHKYPLPVALSPYTISCMKTLDDDVDYVQYEVWGCSKIQFKQLSISRTWVDAL